MQQSILLVGHGTRNPQGQQQFLRLAEHLRGAVAVRVEVAYIELQSPTIDEALLKLHGQGCRKITLSPALLFAAGHAKQDIPAAVARARLQAGDLQVTLAEPLGCQEAVLDLAAIRFSESHSLAPVPRGEGGPAPQQDTDRIPVRTADPTALVLIGRGSSDPAAIAHCQEFAALLAQRVTTPKMFTGFIAIARPSLPEALEQAAASGAQQIVVQPHLLFSGEMLDSTAAAVSQAGKQHPLIDWRQAECLGADLLNPSSPAADLLARALVARIQLANTGI